MRPKIFRVSFFEPPDVPLRVGIFPPNRKSPRVLRALSDVFARAMIMPNEEMGKFACNSEFARATQLIA
jgi:hypothetical protein